MQECDVAIIGAGPYGLSAAAHLRSAGVDTRVFGEPMTFWQQHMPAGMYLRSPWVASHIADPHHTLTLNAYQRAHGIQIQTPIPLDHFVRYGQWFQRQVVPDLNQRRVLCVERAPRGFHLVLEDGAPVQARRVVIATGIAAFAWRPPQFNALPRSLASHSSEHRDLHCFAGQRVLVVGGGQSALESAALLHEAGAEVEVVARAPRIHWLHRSAWLHSRGRVLRLLLYAPTDVGPAGLSWVVALPDVFRCVPHQLQRPIARRCIRPAGAAWLLPRLSGVPMTTGRTVVTAMPAGARLRLRFDDGRERCVDHVLLATGYRVDVTRQTVLAPGLVRSLQRSGGYPTLAAGFQSSVPGLHFLGAPAAASFGPLMRFVAGTGYAARALTRHVVDHWQG